MKPICETCLPAATVLEGAGEFAERAKLINACVIRRYERELEQCPAEEHYPCGNCNGEGRKEAWLNWADTDICAICNGTGWVA